MLLGLPLFSVGDEVSAGDTASVGETASVGDTVTAGDTGSAVVRESVGGSVDMIRARSDRGCTSVKLRRRRYLARGGGSRIDGCYNVLNW